MKPTERKSRLLIVDDHYRNLELLLHTLSDDKMEVLSVDSGIKALKLLETETVDLILLDILMPGLDGYETCRRIKENPATKRIPIIFLTAKADSKDIVKGFQLGAVDYITKPFNTHELISRVYTHIELKRSNDIIREQNEQLDQKNKELEQANALKNTFFNIIARDLKEPFSILIGSANLLMEKFDIMETEKIKRFNQIIGKTSQSGYNLLENLLEWSRLQTDTVEYMPRPLSQNDLTEAMERVISLHKAVAKNAGITVSLKVLITDHDPDTPLLNVDVSMLKAIIRNLLSNAIKHSDRDGEIILSVHLNTTSCTNENCIEFAVIDNGCGLKAEDIDKLFRIDVRQAVVGTARERGSGLGLILCKELVDKNKGKIWVESEQGKGSTFRVSFPASQPTTENE